MKNKLLSLLLTLALLSGVSFAGYTQESDTEQPEQSTEKVKKPKREKDAFYLGKFWDNWFITAGGGASLYFSNLDKSFDFKDRWGEAYRLGFGKVFLPGYGFRLQAAGGKANVIGQWVDPSKVKGEQIQFAKPYKNGLSMNTFNYINLNAAVFFNFMDLIGGYKPERVYSVIPYVSAGVIRVYQPDWKTSENDEMSLSIGVMNYFRLSEHWGLNLEAEAILQRTEAYKASGTKTTTASGTKTKTAAIYRNVDILFPVTLNLQYNFGPGFKKVVCLKGDACSELEKRLQEKEDELNNLRNYYETLPPADTIYVEKIRPVAVPSEAQDPITEPVYAILFKLDKSEIDPSQRGKLKTIADVISRTSANYVLKGYADPDTGSKQRNEVLSRSRANTVYSELIKLGVSALRLRKASYPGERPFVQQEMNRVVLVEPIGKEEIFEKNHNN